MTTPTPPPAQTEPGCPKHMVYGPCGGVRADLTCEMGPVPCPFATDGGRLVEWLGDARRGPAHRSSLLTAARSRPVVLTDLTLRPFDRDLLGRVTEVLAGSCDALLVGEHQHKPDFPPTLLAALIGDAGGRPIVTLSCRDRNRVVLEQEIAGLAETDVEAVLCVTGDGRAPGIRSEVTQVFDLDGTRLAALAADAGLVVAVPEAPHAPPRALRARRLLQKQRAGSRLAVLNHVGSVAGVERFVVEARAVGVTLPMIAGVAVYTDPHSADVLLRFPGLHLDPDDVSRVLGADDPVSAGIDAAVVEARALLSVDGIVGVNVSGLGSADGELAAARVKAAVGRAIREATG